MKFPAAHVGATMGNVNSFIYSEDQFAGDKDCAMDYFLKFKADDAHDYGSKVAARQTFEPNGEILYFVEGNLLSGNEYSDMLVFLIPC